MRGEIHFFCLLGIKTTCGPWDKSGMSAIAQFPEIFIWLGCELVLKASKRKRHF